MDNILHSIANVVFLKTCIIIEQIKLLSGHGGSFL